MMVPVQLGLIPLYMLMVQARLDGHAPGGHRAVPGQRLRRVHDAAVRRAGRSPTSSSRRRASTAPPRSGSSGQSCCPRCGPPRRCWACSPSWRRWNDFLWPLPRARRRTTRPCRCRCRRCPSGYYTDYALVFAGTAPGDPAAAHRLHRVRPPDHRRHHGRCGQGVTIADPHPALHSRAATSRRLRLGRGHRRATRSRAPPPRTAARRRSGTPSRHTPGGCVDGDTGDVAGRPLPPLRATTSR